MRVCATNALLVASLMPFVAADSGEMASSFKDRGVLQRDFVRETKIGPGINSKALTCSCFKTSWARGEPSSTPTTTVHAAFSMTSTQHESRSTITTTTAFTISSLVDRTSSDKQQIFALLTQDHGPDHGSQGVDPVQIPGVWLSELTANLIYPTQAPSAFRATGSSYPNSTNIVSSYPASQSTSESKFSAPLPPPVTSSLPVSPPLMTRDTRISHMASGTRSLVFHDTVLLTDSTPVTSSTLAVPAAVIPLPETIFNLTQVVPSEFPAPPLPVTPTTTPDSGVSMTSASITTTAIEDDTSTFLTLTASLPVHNPTTSASSPRLPVMTAGASSSQVKMRSSLLFFFTAVMGSVL